ncbi:hypothetical protein EDD11_003164 [Mortierella claussenii]|nr:hypothetical protein EDD11_003164 [Mortierella claussenii]
MSSSGSLRVQPLTSQNRGHVGQLVMDTHMRSVPALFNLLKLRPLALILWTAISTVILKWRQTHLSNYQEVLTVLAGSVILAQGVLFLTLLYEATTQVPGNDVVGQLNNFVDHDQDQNQDLKSPEMEASASEVTVGAAKKRSAAGTAGTESESGQVERMPKDQVATLKAAREARKDNRFWVLENCQAEGGVVGCIGALINKTNSSARLVTWAVQQNHQRNGCGTLLLKAAMDQLSGIEKDTCFSGQSSKKDKVQKVTVVLQGFQVPALRLFHKFGFKQVDRTPEWMGEKVVLEILTKDWIQSQKQKK